jgi:DNA modification methylase/rubredoxin
MKRPQDQLDLPDTEQPKEELSSIPLNKEAYRQRLADALKDPEFRKIEGFPLGSDEDILTLSDPPFYTACPNPFLNEILEQWQQERTKIRKKKGLPDDAQNGYHRDPFASDVSEGKNDPIYNAHSYHTKVPHKAIMRYILHYTDPGDIVLDGFCGTGMTGVAAQLCADKKVVESLGYKVQKDGTIQDEEGEPFFKLGARKAVMNDLSPAATFIAYNYNTPVDARVFEKEATRILKEVEKECGWMYETWHPNSEDAQRVKGRINYTVWSDVFVCPSCGKDMVFWDVAVEAKEDKIKDDWNCLGCGALLAKTPKKGSGAQRVEHAHESVYDRALGKTIVRAKQAPVLINYSIGKKRFEKEPDTEDLALIQKIEESDIPYPYPINELPKGFNTEQPKISHGITHVHHFYTHRNLWVLASVCAKCFASININPFWVTASLIRTSKLYKFTLDRKMGTVSGTLYIPSLWTENSSFKLLKNKLVIKDILLKKGTPVFITTCSSTDFIQNTGNYSDYIFIDPPFGGNLMYSELNFLWEAWLKVFTNNHSEAIINKIQHKGLPEYQDLMEQCFKQFYQALKPGRWMTVEFHNSQNAVWNAIQEALLQAGFVVADVRTLDKQQGTFKQVTTTAAVKQDLIISAYKPTETFERTFLQEAGSEAGAWDFIRQHLKQLPIPGLKKQVIEFLEERMPYLLYDRMLAFHIQRGLIVPLSAPEFYQGLAQRYLQRDGMYFLPDQAAEYDMRRTQAKSVEQLALFLSDERSAIQWLRRELDKVTGNGPQTYQDLQPNFVRELHQTSHEAMPELKLILEQNFLQDAEERWFVPDIANTAHLEALRQKNLLHEFEDAVRSKGSLKKFRSEAIRAGFSEAWRQREYAKIVSVAERLPEAVLQEDSSLLMYYHNAKLRDEKRPRQEALI